jgi:excisionase family DNA binding protein
MKKPPLRTPRTNPSSNTDDPGALVRWPAVAKRLEVGERALWRLVRDHALPVYRLNARVIRFRLSEIDSWLGARRAGGAL